MTYKTPKLSFLKRLRLAVDHCCRSECKVNKKRYAVWPSDVAASAGIALIDLNNLLRGGKKPNEDVIDRLAYATGVSSYWLKTGDTSGKGHLTRSRGALLTVRKRVLDQSTRDS